MFNQTVEDILRTNDNIEAWHNSFQVNISSNHTMFWKFLDVLLREKRIDLIRMFQNQAGRTWTRTTKT